MRLVVWEGEGTEFTGKENTFYRGWTKMWYKERESRRIGISLRNLWEGLVREVRYICLYKVKRSGTKWRLGVCEVKEMVLCQVEVA